MSFEDSIRTVIGELTMRLSSYQHQRQSLDETIQELEATILGLKNQLNREGREVPQSVNQGSPLKLKALVTEEDDEKEKRINPSPTHNDSADKLRPLGMYGFAGKFIREVIALDHPPTTLAEACCLVYGEGWETSYSLPGGRGQHKRPSLGQDLDQGRKSSFRQSCSATLSKLINYVERGEAPKGYYATDSLKEVSARLAQRQNELLALFLSWGIF